ncbi:hypothetical protein BKA65DRAFT_592799 [Rhexocercosporidium sp. MPI-PUGE-AT-0058]|nr:hypothetical protein BKA65DRAFT_592799 [Rhexocercosporidium sp. MPI-PUGE-AT-0058]
MRLQLSSLFRVLSVADAAIIPGLDSIAGISAIIGGLVPIPAPALVPAAAPVPALGPVKTSATAGTFTIVEPERYLLSLSQPTQSYFTASLNEMLNRSSPLIFVFDAEHVNLIDFVPGRFSLGPSGVGLGMGLPAGFGTTNPKLSYANQGFQTANKNAKFCVEMTNSGTKFAFGSKVHVHGTEREQFNDEGCIGVFLYAQLL